MKQTFQRAAEAEPQDVYTTITARIIADLEQGVRPWNVGNLLAIVETAIVAPLRA